MPRVMLCSRACGCRHRPLHSTRSLLPCAALRMQIAAQLIKEEEKEKARKMAAAEDAAAKKAAKKVCGAVCCCAALRGVVWCGGTRACHSMPRHAMQCNAMAAAQRTGNRALGHVGHTAQLLKPE